MKDSEIGLYLKYTANPMKVRCRTCGEFYGSHVGRNCGNGGKFYPETNSTLDTETEFDPNIAFLRKKFISK